MPPVKWCDEKYPELRSEIRVLWCWIARYNDDGFAETDVGERIDRVLDEIIRKAKGELL